MSRMLRKIYSKTIMSVRKNDLMSFIRACTEIRNDRNDGLLDEDQENQLFAECLKNLEGKHNGKVISFQ